MIYESPVLLLTLLENITVPQFRVNSTKNIERFSVNKMSGQIFQPIETVRPVPWESSLNYFCHRKMRKNTFILRTCGNVTRMSLLEMQIFFCFNLS